MTRPRRRLRRGMADGRAGRWRKSGRKTAQADAADAQDDGAAAATAASQPDGRAQNGLHHAGAASPSASRQENDGAAGVPTAAGAPAGKTQRRTWREALWSPLPSWLLQAIAMALIAWATTAMTGARRHACHESAARQQAAALSAASAMVCMTCKASELVCHHGTGWAGMPSGSSSSGAGSASGAHSTQQFERVVAPARGPFPAGCKWRAVSYKGKPAEIWDVREYEYWDEAKGRWSAKQPSACTVRGEAKTEK